MIDNKGVIIRDTDNIHITLEYSLAEVQNALHRHPYYTADFDRIRKDVLFLRSVGRVHPRMRSYKQNKWLEDIKKRVRDYVEGIVTIKWSDNPIPRSQNFKKEIDETNETIRTGTQRSKVIEGRNSATSVFSCWCKFRR